MLTFVDANVFIRLFVEDDAQQMNQAAKLFEKAQNGKIDLVTGPPVFFEVAWTLSYRYKVSRGDILDILEAVLSFPNLKVLDKGLVLSAVSLARETGSEFADSYIASTIQDSKAANIATFNKKHFVKLGTSLYPLEKAKKP